MTVYGKTSGSDAPTQPAARLALSVRLPAFAACATLAVALAVVFGVWRLVHDQLQGSAFARFEWRAAQTTVDLRNKLGACEETLRGAAGFVAAAPQAASSATQVAPAAWQRYVTRLDLDEKQPAVRALGYAAVQANAVVRLADEIKADDTADAKAGALPDDNSPRVPVTLMYPSRPGTAPLAYDLGNDPSRRGALLRAADTGQPALVSRPAVFDTRADPYRPRFELYLPVYRSLRVPATTDARRADVAGFVVAYLDADWLLGSLEVHERNIDMDVYSGTPATLVYASSDAADNLPAQTLFSRTETLRFGGEPLTLVYTTDDRPLGGGDTLSSAVVLTFGVLASVLAAALVFHLARERSTP